MAICEREGLDPDTFDIPGRVKRTRAEPPPKSRYRDDLFTRPRAPRDYEMGELRDAMRRFAEGMHAAAKAAQARPGETAYDARRRNFDEQAAAARDRDRAHATKRRTDAAAADLWRLGVRCYQDEEGWRVEMKEGLALVTADELCVMAAIARQHEAQAKLQRERDAARDQVRRQ